MVNTFPFNAKLISENIKRKQPYKAIWSVNKFKLISLHPPTQQLLEIINL